MRMRPEELVHQMDDLSSLEASALVHRSGFMAGYSLRQQSCLVTGTDALYNSGAQLEIQRFKTSISRVR